MKYSRILLFNSSFERMSSILDDNDAEIEIKKIELLRTFIDKDERAAFADVWYNRERVKTSDFSSDCRMWFYYQESLNKLYCLYGQRFDHTIWKYFPVSDIVPHFVIHPLYKRLLYLSTRIYLLKHNKKYKTLWPNSWNHLQNGDCEGLPESPFNPHPVTEQEIKYNSIWIERFKKNFPEIMLLNNFSGG